MSDRVVRVSFTAQVANYVSGLEQMRTATSKTSAEGTKFRAQTQAQRQVMDAVGKTAVVAGAAILGVGLAAAKTGIAYNAMQQQSRAALTTMLGSAQAANEQMDKLDAFARTSPFAKQVFIQAQQQMLAFGIETSRVIPYLAAVQDAIAAAGGGEAELAGIVAIMSKIQSSTKITAADLNQFGRYGIDAAALIGSAMGKTGAQIRAEITAGTLGATEALDALTQGMSARFGGAAENVKQTFDGALDRVKAAWRDFSSVLMTPLVNPNGGGALVDAMNWAADMMRAFEKLPGPVKATISVLTLATGAVLLLGGTALLAIPKLVAFQAALATMGATGPAGLVGGFLRLGPAIGAAAVAAGPAALAFGAILGAGYAAKKGLDAMKASSAEMQNSLTTATSAAEIFKTATQGEQWKIGQLFGDPGTWEQLQDLPRVLEAGARAGRGFWASVWEGDSASGRRVLKEIGKELGDLALNDLPSAQNGFRLLAEQTDGSHQQLWRLLASMPDLRTALTQQAQAMGIAADEGNLVAIALGEIGGEADAAARASSGLTSGLEEINDQSETTRKGIDELASAIKGFGSEAMSVDAATDSWYATLEKVTESVQKNGQTLDATTEAGRGNRAMLRDLANVGLDLVSANAKAGDSSAELTAQMADSRESFIDTATAMGATREEAEALADSYGLIPDDVTTIVKAQGLEDAQEKTDALIRTITSMPDGEITLDTADIMDVYGELERLGVKISEPKDGKVTLTYDPSQVNKGLSSTDEWLERVSKGTAIQLSANDKEILDALKIVGIKTTTLPDGSIVVGTKDVTDADKKLKDLNIEVNRPKNGNVTVTVSGDAAAKKKVDDVAKDQDTTVTVKADTTKAEADMNWFTRARNAVVNWWQSSAGQANGGMWERGVQAYAKGQFVSGIYEGRPGGLIKFAEPETRWEAYISGKPGMEARSRRILEMTAQRLGMSVVDERMRHFADGALLANQPDWRFASTPIANVAGPTVQVAAPSLDGMHVVGELDMGNGLTALMDAHIRAYDDSRRLQRLRGSTGG